jgi:hypothetical protein
LLIYLYNAREKNFAQAKYSPHYNDWEAPTGGYLLTACFASGHAAGLGALNWLHEMSHSY